VTLDARTVREWGRLYSNWGRWGPDDELGTLNFITPERVLAAASLPRSGMVVSCALPFAADGAGGAHWEPLATVAYDGRVYNDRDPADLPACGAHPASIDRIGDGIVGRGVLLDLPHFLQRPWLDAGAAIAPDQLDACAEASGVTVESGDILLVRTGWMGRHFVSGTRESRADDPAPGLALRCARWLFERQIAAIAADTACVEVVPAETPDCARPLHRIAARDIGLWFGVAFHLDRLADACAADGRYAFLFAAPPLPTTGALDAPINPLAIK
jgi:kynurenine formamidase